MKLNRILLKSPRYHLNLGKLPVTGNDAELVSKFIKLASISSRHCSLPYTYLDIEMRDVKEGQKLSNRLWHVDGNPNQKAEDVMVWLYINSEDSLTEFSEAFDYVTTETWGSAKIFHAAMEDIIYFSEESNPIIANKIFQYNGKTIHRGPISKSDHRRIRLRLLKSIKPLSTYIKL